MKKRLAIIGAGEMALQVKHFAEIDGRYSVVGFYVDYPEDLKFVEGLPILGKINDVENGYSKDVFDCAFIAIGYNHLSFKSSLHKRLKNTIPFATIIANPTYIDTTAEIGNDVIIYPGTIIDREVVVEDNVLLNMGSTISHNSVIGNGSFIGVRTAISGFCKIGGNCFLGTNSTLSDNISICDNVVVGASTLVIRDIDNPGTYVGVPARKVK